jgi:choline dehydrogenase
MTELSVADYVVVGAGSIGSVIARGLIDAGRYVHVIEAGGTDNDPAVNKSAELVTMLQNGSHD